MQAEGSPAEEEVPGTMSASEGSPAEGEVPETVGKSGVTLQPVADPVLRDLDGMSELA